MFGRFDVYRPDPPPSTLGGRRARELLSYLVLHRNRPQQREALAGTLWNDLSPELARKRLRQALWQIQAAFNAHPDRAGANVLEVDPEWILMNSCDCLDVDVIRFEDATRSCRGISGAQLDDAQLQRLEEAVSLYGGGLLEGWCQEWCQFERQRLQNDFLDALERLVCACEARGDTERGLAHTRRMLAIDPALERAHCHIMRLHALAGNRTEALREYQRCESVLMEELGVAPSAATRALHQSIREGHGEHARPAVLPAHAVVIDPFGLDLPALVEHLERLQVTFAGNAARLRQQLPAADAGAPALDRIPFDRRNRRHVHRRQRDTYASTD
jgi:DNA-binding SARP family transcriptional activator